MSDFAGVSLVLILYFSISIFKDLLRDHNNSFIFNIGLVLFLNVNIILSMFNSNIIDNIKHKIIILDKTLYVSFFLIKKNIIINIMARDIPIKILKY